MKGAAHALGWAQHLWAGLLAGGVRHAVIAPGSRSTVLVLAALEQAGLEKHVLPDERAAAFFALGLGRATGRPAALVTTSGTAAANALPAVVEAGQAQVPLVLLTADRPPEARFCSANQTIDQARIYGNFVRAAFPIDVHEDLPLQTAVSFGLQATDRALWPEPGPVHLNLGLPEPQIPDKAPEPPAAADAAPARSCLVPEEETLDRLCDRISGRPGLLVAGASPLGREAKSALLRLADGLRAPLLADPLSGLRFGLPAQAPVCAHQDAWLHDAAFLASLAPEWVLQIGAPPVSRALTGWLDRLADAGVLVLRVKTGGEWPDPGRRGDWLLHADPAALARALQARHLRPADPALRDTVLARDRTLAAWLQENEQELPPEARILRRLLARLPEGAQLFIGNSLAIRDADRFLGLSPREIAPHGNRGASGIDGNLSTALGIAAAHPDQRTVAVLGDLTFWHDANGLLAAREHPALFVVFDNGGGGIFELLPQSQLPRERFERYWLSPTGVDPCALAAAYGLPCRRVASVEEFDPALAAALEAPQSRVLVIAVDRADSTARRHTFLNRMETGSWQ